MTSTSPERQAKYRARKRAGLVRTKPAAVAALAQVDRVLAQFVDGLSPTPDLSAGRCVGHWSLFDPPAADESDAALAGRHKVAVAECRVCPVLAACRDWSAALPPKYRPGGVVAGRITEGGPH